MINIVLVMHKKKYNLGVCFFDQTCRERGAKNRKGGGPSMKQAVDV